MHSARSSRAPSIAELNLCNGRFKLSGVLFEDEIEDLMPLARRRIVDVFLHFRKTTPRRPIDREEREFDSHHGVKLLRTIEVDTDNYITGVEPRQAALAEYLVAHLRSPFVSQQTFSVTEWVRGKEKASLRENFAWLNEVPPDFASRFFTAVHYKVILLELNQLARNGDIWFDEGHGGLWQMKQSVVDARIKLGGERRRTNRKYDDRSEHGQVRAQRKHRERPAGTSTGQSKSSRPVGRASW